MHLLQDGPQVSQSRGNCQMSPFGGRNACTSFASSSKNSFVQLECAVSFVYCKITALRAWRKPQNADSKHGPHDNSRDAEATRRHAILTAENLNATAHRAIGLRRPIISEHLWDPGSLDRQHLCLEIAVIVPGISPRSFLKHLSKQPL